MGIRNNTTASVPAVVKEIQLDAANVIYDTAATKLTLAQTNGAPSVVVDLAALSKSSVINSTSVTLNGDGSAANPLQAAVIVKANGGILSGTAGLELDAVNVNKMTHDVILTDLAGNFIASAGSQPTA